jgi:hypothetical protein
MRASVSILPFPDKGDLASPAIVSTRNPLVHVVAPTGLHTE